MNEQKQDDDQIDSNDQTDIQLTTIDLTDNKPEHITDSYKNEKPNPNPKRHTKKFIIILSSIVLIVALIGVLGFVYWQQNKQIKTTDTTATTSDNANKITLQVPVTTGLDIEYKTTVIDVYDLIKKDDALSVKYTTDTTVAPLYKSDSSKYYLYANNTYGVVIDGDSSSDWNAYLGILNSEITSYLSSHKYSKLITDGHTYYISSKSICELPDATKNVPAYFSCADIASYVKTDGTKPVESSSELLSADETVTASYQLINSINAPKVMNIKPNFTTKSGPIYHPSGTTYNVAASKNVTFTITGNGYDGTGMRWDALMSPVFSNLDIFMTSHGFKKSAIDSGLGGEVAAYSSPTVTCSLTSVNVSDVAFTCANIADYPISVMGEYQFVSVLASAGISEDTHVFGTPTVKNSLTPGYQTATMSVGPKEGGVGGSIALLYKKVGENWKYFISVQQGPGCSAYNTDELKAAYAGDYCYDSTGKDSIVQ